MFWAICIPYLALLALAIIEGKGALNWSQRFIRFGIDACVLGIGVCGAIFANEAVQAHFGKNATGIAVVCLLVTLALTGLCLHLREFAGISEKWRARLSIFLGLLILAINSEVARWSS
jgi:hypothetical protein